jgi:hypothetical protein
MHAAEIRAAVQGAYAAPVPTAATRQQADSRTIRAMPANTKLAAALEAVRRGFSVFPLRPNAKIPAIKNWRNLATTDKTQIAAWWSDDPDYNVGGVTDDKFVADLDPRNGGVETVEALKLCWSNLGATPTTTGIPTAARHAKANAFPFRTPKLIPQTSGVRLRNIKTLRRPTIRAGQSAPASKRTSLARTSPSSRRTHNGPIWSASIASRSPKRGACCRLAT